MEVECLPDALPEHITVDVSKLNIGDILHVSELVVPEGVKILTHGDLVVFTVIDPNAVPEDLPEPAESAEGEAAEPEVVGAKEKAEKAAAAEADKAAAKK